MLLLQGKALYFVTNSNSMSRVELLETFHQLGIEAHEVGGAQVLNQVLCYHVSPTPNIPTPTYG